MDKKHLRQFAIFYTVGLLLSAGQASAREDIMVNGQCDITSHVAEGLIGEDVTKRGKDFTCTSALVTFFDTTRRHAMITFIDQKQSIAKRILRKHSMLAFGGNIQPNGVRMNLTNVYFNAGEATPADGWCEFYFNGPDLRSIFCGAKIDEAGHRTTAMIIFRASN